MLEDHRSGPRHDSLLSSYPEDDSNNGWMISYIDIMTLLVALFVIIIAAAGVTGPGWSPEADDTDVSESSVPALEVPLPALLEERRQKRNIAYLNEPGTLSPMAISAALGVAGLPAPVMVMPEPAEVPPLLALAPVEPASPVAPLLERYLPALPTPLLTHETQRSGQPLANYMVLLTDRPPVNVQQVEDEAISSALALDEQLSERVESSLYLTDLDGVEVSRVAEGISLRVQDQLLFPSAAAGLSEGGTSLVGSLLETIQRYDGEVWVEGHSDSQSINTPEFSSNWALSSARAIAIVEALEAGGVEPERLRAVGFADTRPLEDNSSAEGRARNRRVEVVIHVE